MKDKMGADLTNVLHLEVSHLIIVKRYRTRHKKTVTCTALSSTSTANTWAPPATCMYITNSNSPRALFWMLVMITSLGWICTTCLLNVDWVLTADGGRDKDVKEIHTNKAQMYGTVLLQCALYLVLATATVWHAWVFIAQYLFITIAVVFLIVSCTSSVNCHEYK